MRLAGDCPDRAVAAATATVMAAIGTTVHPVVLHTSNNVVVQFGDTIAKVGTDTQRLRKEVSLARHVADHGGPAVAPLAELSEHDGFAISLWPALKAPLDASQRDAALALRRLHAGWSDHRGDVPPLDAELAQPLSMLEDAATTNLGASDRAALQAVLTEAQRCAAATSTAGIVHGEPHDRNWMQRDEALVFIDFESAVVGPVEWDAAYFTNDVVEAVWPTLDQARLSVFRLAVSAVVATFCWRAVQLRPDDATMRWHADHHLSLVRAARS